MTDRVPYSFVVLRYVHDVFTGEFLNVDVVMHVPSQCRVHVRTQ